MVQTVIPIQFLPLNSTSYWVLLTSKLRFGGNHKIIMIVWIQLCFYGYAWVMEMWILHLLAGNYVFGEKPLDSYELWKCEHYGSGDKSKSRFSRKRLNVLNSSQSILLCIIWKNKRIYFESYTVWLNGASNSIISGSWPD